MVVVAQCRSHSDDHFGWVFFNGFKQIFARLVWGFFCDSNSYPLRLQIGDNGEVFVRQVAFAQQVVQYKEGRCRRQVFSLPFFPLQVRPSGGTAAARFVGDDRFFVDQFFLLKCFLDDAAQEIPSAPRSRGCNEFHRFFGFPTGGPDGTASQNYQETCQG